MEKWIDRRAGRGGGCLSERQEARPLISFLVKSFFNEKIRPPLSRKRLKYEDTISPAVRTIMPGETNGRGREYRRLKATFFVASHH